MSGQDTTLDPVASTTRQVGAARSPRHGTTTILDAARPSPAPPVRRFEDLDLSRAFGRYRVVRQLGRGGAGLVFEARSPRGRAVAIKLLVNKDPEALERFRREHDFLGQLVDRRGFVSLLDAGACAIGPYLVLELMEGGSLKDRLRREPMAIADVVRLGRSLARALGQAHALGIIHRDIKPANILYDRRGRPTIADLGIGKHFRRARDPRQESASLTAVGQAMGTPAYMAPEQLDDSRSVGPAADVYALGAVLYECLTGQPLYRGSNAAELMLQCVQGRWVSVRALRPDCPVWLAAVVERCLSRAPEGRFANGRALARALAPSREPGPGRLWSLAYAGAVALVLLFACALLLSESPEPATRRRGVRSLERRPAFLDAPSNAVGKHRGVLVDLALHPSGGSVFTAGLDGVIRSWSLDHGSSLAMIDAGLARLDGIALSGDGRRLLAGGRSHGRRDNALRAWDLASGRLIFERVEPGEARPVIFAGDRARCYAVLGSRIVLVDGARCASVTVPEEDPGPLSAAAVVPGRDLMMLCDQVGGLTLIHLASGRVVGRGRIPSRGVMQALMIAEGRRVLLAERSGYLSSWSIEPFEELKRVRIVRSQDDRFEGALRCLALSADGQRIFCAGDDFAIQALDRSSLERVATLARLESWVSRLEATADGRGLVSVGGDRVARLWDLSSGGERWRRTGHSGSVLALACSPADGSFATLGADRSLRIWSSDGAAITRRSVGLTKTAALAFSPNGLILAAAGRVDRKGRALGGLQIWRLDRSGDRRPRVIAPAPASALAWDEAGRLWVGDAAGGVSCLRLESQTLERIEAHPGSVSDFAPGPSGTWLSFGRDGGAARWRRGALISPAKRGAGPAGWVLAGRDGGALLCLAGRGLYACSAGERELVDRVSGTPLRGAFSAKSGLLALSWEEGGAGLWDLNSGRAIEVLDPRWPEERVTALDFDGEGERLILGTERGLVLRFALRPKRCGDVGKARESG